MADFSAGPPPRRVFGRCGGGRARPPDSDHRSGSGEAGSAFGPGRVRGGHTLFEIDASFHRAADAEVPRPVPAPRLRSGHLDEDHLMLPTTLTVSATAPMLKTKAISPCSMTSLHSPWSRTTMSDT